MDNTKKERTACEVYSRVVGYLRPVGQWNDAKKAEYYDRVPFDKSVDDIVKKIK